jgi:UDP-N-acetylglucosamine 2-epimerase
MVADVVTVIGARPQFVKAAVVSRSLKAAGVSEQVIHTGQHYDHDMSDSFLNQLGIDNVAVNLGVGSGAQGHQTATMMTGIEHFLLGQELPKVMVLYGDTNSTLAGALVASKLHIPIVHVEAGLRSFNRAMPEEVNRIVVDHLSSVLFCSSEEGVGHLKNEGIETGVHVVGDVMLDAYHHYSTRSPAVETNLPAEDFALVTIHRPSNADSPDQLKKVIASLGTLDLPIVWPVHPRTLPILSRLEVPSRFHLTEPFDYFSMLAALNQCSLVVTDSGGLQKEAHWSKTPCLTMRGETEWVETLDGNWNHLCTAGDDLSDLVKMTQAPWGTLYGDGEAGKKIVSLIIANFFSS